MYKRQKLINLTEGVTVASVAKVRDKEEKAEAQRSARAKKAEAAREAKEAKLAAAKAVSYTHLQRTGPSNCLTKTQVYAKPKGEVYELTPARCWKVTRRC